jgi:hypothetical protein
MTIEQTQPHPIERFLRAWLDIPAGERIAALAAFHALLSMLQGLPEPEKPAVKRGRKPGSKNRPKVPVNGSLPLAETQAAQ